MPSVAVLALLVIFVSFPLYSMALTAFKTDKEIYDDFTYFPKQPTLVQFQRVIVGERFGINIRNSLIVATTSTVISVTMSVLAAFAVVRLRFHGRVWVARLILFKYLLPTTLIYIPLFLVVNGLGLANTLQSLIFTYLSFSIPFATWLLMGYFRGIPADLEEQAMIDGCSRVGAMVRVLLPIASPGVAAAAIFTFTGAWNEFLLALVFINKPDLQTVPVKLAGMIVGDQYVWGAIMAGAILAALPVVILYFLAQRFVVSGLAAGAVKG
ncbi:MAG: carbohydrate ABC transporter permease [Chloroflexota bacterium]